MGNESSVPVGGGGGGPGIRSRDSTSQPGAPRTTPRSDVTIRPAAPQETRVVQHEVTGLRLPAMALVIEAVVWQGLPEPQIKDSHVPDLFCLAMLDGKEVGRTVQYPSAPFSVVPRSSMSVILLRFFAEADPSGFLASAEVASTALAEVALPLGKLIKYGAPLYTSLWLGFPFTGSAAGGTESFQEALWRASMPSVPKVGITLFTPSKCPDNESPKRFPFAPRNTDIRSAFIEHDLALDCCGGDTAMMLSSAEQIRGLLEALRASNITTLALQDVVSHSGSQVPRSAADGTAAAEAHRFELQLAEKEREIGRLSAQIYELKRAQSTTPAAAPPSVYSVPPAVQLVQRETPQSSSSVPGSTSSLSPGVSESNEQRKHRRMTLAIERLLKENEALKEANMETARTNATLQGMVDASSQNRAPDGSSFEQVEKDAQQALDQIVTRMNGELSVERERFEQAQSELTELRQQSAQGQGAENDTHRITGELAAVREHLAEAQRELERVRHENSRQGEELARSTAELVVLRTADEERQALKEELAGMSELVEALEAGQGQQEALASNLAAVRAEVEALRDEKERNGVELLQSQARHEFANRQRKDFQERLKQALVELETFRRARARSAEIREVGAPHGDRSAADLEDLQDRHAAAVSELEVLRGTEGKVAELEEQLAEALSQNDGLRKAEEDQRETSERLARTNARLSEDMQGDKFKCDQLAAQAERLNEQLKGDRNRYQSTKEDLNRQVSQLHSQRFEDSRAYEDLNAELKAQVSQLKSRSAQEQQSFQAANEALKAQISEIVAHRSKESGEHTAVSDRLNEQLSQLKSQYDMDREEYQALNDELSAQLARAKVQISDAGRGQSALSEQLNAQIVNLQRQLSDITDAYASNNEDLNAEIARLNSQLVADTEEKELSEEQKSRNVKLEKKNARLFEENQKHKDANEALAAKLERNRRDDRSQKDVISKLDAQVEEVREKWVEARQTCESLGSQLIREREKAGGATAGAERAEALEMELAVAREACAKALDRVAELERGREGVERKLELKFLNRLTTAERKVKEREAELKESKADSSTMELRLRKFERDVGSPRVTESINPAVHERLTKQLAFAEEQLQSLRNAEFEKRELEAELETLQATKRRQAALEEELQQSRESQQAREKEHLEFLRSVELEKGELEAQLETLQLAKLRQTTELQEASELQQAHAQDQLGAVRGLELEKRNLEAKLRTMQMSEERQAALEEELQKGHDLQQAREQEQVEALRNAELEKTDLEAEIEALQLSKSRQVALEEELQQAREQIRTNRDIEVSGQDLQDELEHARKQIKDLAPRQVALEAELAQARGQLAEVPTREAETNDKLSAQMEQLLKESRAERANAQADLSSLREGYEQELADIQQQLDSERASSDVGRRRLEELQAMLLEEQEGRSSCEARFAQATGTVAEQDAVVQELQGKLQSAGADRPSDSETLHEEIAALQAKMVAKVAAADRAKAAQAALEGELAEVRRQGSLEKAKLETALAEALRGAIESELASTSTLAHPGGSAVSSASVTDRGAHEEREEDQRSEPERTAQAALTRALGPGDRLLEAAEARAAQEMAQAKDAAAAMEAAAEQQIRERERKHAEALKELEKLVLGQADHERSTVRHELAVQEQQYAELRAQHEELSPQAAAGGRLDDIIMKLFCRLLAEKYLAKAGVSLGEDLARVTGRGAGASAARADMDRVLAPVLKKYEVHRRGFSMHKAFRKFDAQGTGHFAAKEFQEVLEKAFALDAEAAGAIYSTMVARLADRPLSPRSSAQRLIEEQDFLRLFDDFRVDPQSEVQSSASQASLATVTSTEQPRPLPSPRASTSSRSSTPRSSSIVGAPQGIVGGGTRSPVLRGGRR